MKYPLMFVAKHPCDDLPYIENTLPDPRTGHPAFTFDGPDYTGFYIRLPRWISKRITRFWMKSSITYTFNKAATTRRVHDPYQEAHSG